MAKFTHEEINELYSKIKRVDALRKTRGLKLPDALKEVGTNKYAYFRYRKIAYQKPEIIIHPEEAKPIRIKPGPKPKFLQQNVSSLNNISALFIGNVDSCLQILRSLK